MELTENEIIENYAEHCRHCNRNTLLPYEYELTCFSCGYNVRKTEGRTIKNLKTKNNFYQSIEICRTQNFLHMCRCIYSL